MLNFDCPAVHLIYFIVAIAGSIWYGIKAYEIFNVKPVDPCGSVKRIHQFWFNAAGAAVGWLAGWVVLFRWLYRYGSGSSDEVSVGMILLVAIAFAGVTGHLPLALQSLREWSIKHRKPEPPKAADPPAPIPTQVANGHAGAETTGRIPNETSGYTFWLAFATWVIAGAGLLAFGAALLQWNAMRGQLAEMKSGGKDTHDLALAARLDQRAWVGSGNLTLDPPKIGDVVHASVSYVNSGRTPAKKLSPLAHLRFVPTLITSEVELQNLGSEGNQVSPVVGALYPGTSSTTNIDSKTPISELDKSRIMGDWYTYIWGELTYVDVFNEPHAMTFCGYRHGMGGSFLQCPFHNEPDYQKESK